MNRATVTSIAAVGRGLEIGKDNGLLWKLSADMRFFRETTTSGVVIMGRKSWDSIPEKYRPLKNRVNIVVSRDPNLSLPESVILADSIESAIARAKAHEGEIFVIGGAQIYAAAMPHVDRLIITHVEMDYPDADVWFPEIGSEWEKTNTLLTHEADAENDAAFSVFEYSRK